MRGGDKTLAEAAVIRRESAEMEVPAYVRVPPEAHVAFQARGCGIDCDADAGREGPPVPRKCITPAQLDDGGELVPEDEGVRDRRVSDPGVVVRMKVASADAGGSHAKEDLAPTGRGRIGDFLHPQVAGTMEPDALHLRTGTPRRGGALSGN